MNLLQIMPVYFDNAATTKLDTEVLNAMMPYLTEKFGNPSALYSYGRESKSAIETARTSVARLLNCKTSELLFTSGGTESTNMAVQCAVRDLGCTHIITSPIEHHATLHTVERMQETGQVTLSFVKLASAEGQLDLANLEELLSQGSKKTLLTLMHANNEIGNITDVCTVGKLCKKYNAIFHCDMVQTIGHYPISLKDSGIHFASAAGHKFHGPKGVGLLYVNESVKINSLLAGGSQERNLRAGTENLYGIIGFAKALELASQRFEEDRKHIFELKCYMKERLLTVFPQVCFNGDTSKNSLYTVLNAAFPKNEKTEMLVLSLDMMGVCVSGGSACSSSEGVSHVIKALYNGAGSDVVPVRFSFSRHNTKEEIDYVIDKLKNLL